MLIMLQLSFNGLRLGRFIVIFMFLLVLMIGYVDYRKLGEGVVEGVGLVVRAHREDQRDRGGRSPGGFGNMLPWHQGVGNRGERRDR